VQCRRLNKIKKRAYRVRTKLFNCCLTRKRLCVPPREGVQLAGGLNMEIHRAEIFNNALRHSLSTIQAAKTQLHLLTASSLTPTVLVSQIRLCDILLGEIRTISCRLERRIGCPGMVRRRSLVTRRNRGSRHLAAPQGNPADRSKQTR
jgi:hypothetical protein